MIDSLRKFTIVAEEQTKIINPFGDNDADTNYLKVSVCSRQRIVSKLGSVRISALQKK